MKHEGNVERARENFLKERPPVLEALLTNRYSWMKKFIEPSDNIIELGSGTGLSKEFLKYSNFKTTDVTKYEWIDEYVDALNLPFADNSVDIFLCSHMIHHLAKPTPFFQKIMKKLKPNGKILIVEIQTSFFMKSLLYLMKHEGWSYEVDVFDSDKISNSPDDPWSANCAIPELLFDDHKKFHDVHPGLKIIHDEKFECLMFPLSGGVIAKTKRLPIPKILIPAVQSVDQLLVNTVPNLFALGRKVVIRKEKTINA